MKKLLLASVVALLASSSAFADNTDQKAMPVSGKIIASLALGTPTAIEMPTLVVPDTGTAASVSIACANDGTVSGITYTGQGNPYAHGTAAATAPDKTNSANKALGDIDGACGTVAVTGETDYKYQIATAGIAASTDKPEISSIVCRSKTADSITGGVIAAGETLYCGATVIATTATATGDYALTGANTGTVTVTYD